MSDHVYWIIEAKVLEGKLDELKSLMAEMSEATKKNEPKALNYEWSLSANEQVCHIFERYADNDATMVHMGNFAAKFAKRFMGTLKPNRCILYGNPDERVQKALLPLGAHLMKPAAGFSR